MARRYSRFIAHPIRDLLFPENIGRIEYLVRSLVLRLVFLALYGPLEKVLAIHSFRIVAICAAVTTMIAGLVFQIWGAVIPRLRDIPRSPKWAWLLLVPFANVALDMLLLLTPGRARQGWLLQAGKGG